MTSKPLPSGGNGPASPANRSIAPGSVSDGAGLCADEPTTPLVHQPIGGLIRKIAVPASVGFFFHTLFNVVDTWFGGLVSTEALAALSLSFPVFFVIIALGSGLSSGATALIATAVGAQDRHRAGRLAVQGLGFGVLSGLVVTLVGLAAAPWLFGVLGAQGAISTLALEYMNVIFGGGLFFLILYMENAILSALGDTRSFRDFLIFGAILNIGLDAWFMFGGFGVPALGLTGIALATVVIQAFGVVYLGFKVRRAGLVGRISWRDWAPDPALYAQIARQGVPASLNVATIGLGIFIITGFITRFGPEGVAAYGAAMRVEQMVLMPGIGLNVATLTLVAQNHGAGRMDRVHETVRLASLWGALMMMVGGVLVFILARPLMSLFSSDAKVVAVGVTYLRIESLVLYAYLLLSIHVAALQGVKKPVFPLFLGVYRQVAAPLLVYWAFSRLWGLVGVWWGIFLVTWSGALIAMGYGRYVLGRTDQPVSTPVSGAEDTSPIT